MSPPCLAAKLSAILFFFCLAALASAQVTGPLVRIGPGSYDNITAEVKELKLHDMRRRAASEPSKTQKMEKERNRMERTRLNADNKFEKCCGVYVCDQEGFKGNCYWECYPEYHEIYPNGWWVKNVVSFGPDPDVKAYLSHGECTIRGPFDKIEYPGKTLKEGLKKNLGCFYVAYQYHVG